MVRMLNRYRHELAVEATSQELEATARATERQLTQDTATVTIEKAEWMNGTLALDVSVQNLTGHKLPTGYPSRRLWLRVAVRGEEGLVFESGAIADSGAIESNDNDRDPMTFEPHHLEISSPAQVQIYESIMGTARDVPTTGLLQATQYLKDNRLLPRGFDKLTAPPEIAVKGEAVADSDFSDLGDRVRYVISTGRSQGPWTVDVELRFQAIGFRWAANLEPYTAEEPRRFGRYFKSMSSSSSVVVARASARLKGEN